MDDYDIWNNLTGLTPLLFLSGVAVFWILSKFWDGR